MPKFKLNSDKNLSIVARPVHNYEQENLAETLEFILPVSLLGRNVLDCITSVHIIDASEHADVITLDLSVSERNPNYLVDSFKLSGLFTQEDGLIRLWIEIIDRTDTAILKTNEVSFPVFHHEVVDEYITDEQISFIEQGLIQTADYVDQAREYAEGAEGSAAAAREIAQSVRDDADAGLFDGKSAYPVKNVSSMEEVEAIQSDIVSGEYSADTAYAFVASAFSTYIIGDMLAITADDVTIDFHFSGTEKPYLSLERISQYLYNVSFLNVADDTGAPSTFGGCSSYVNDGKLYRNLDFHYDNKATFHVRLPHIEGLACIDGLTDTNIDDRLIGQLPYHLTDGVNDDGIMVSTHILYNDWEFQGDGSIPLTRLPYLILKNAKSIATLNDDIGDLLTNIYVPQEMANAEYLMQILVTDGTSTSLLTPKTDGSGEYEIIDITSNPKLTNFKWVSSPLVDRTSLQTRPTGVERWNMMPDNLSELRFTEAYESPDRLSEFIGLRGTTKDSSDEELLEIYNEAHTAYEARTRDGETWQTMHSAVYSPKGIEHLWIQEDWDTDYAASSSGGGFTDGTLPIFPVATLDDITAVRAWVVSQGFTSVYVLAVADIELGGIPMYPIGSVYEVKANGTYVFVCNLRPPVDQTFNHDSVNAQSGLAVEQAIQGLSHIVFGRINPIEEAIPSEASSSNKLVSESQMGDAISSVEAKQLYKTALQGSFATKAELTSATTFYGADGTVAIPTKNDVAYVLADESRGGISTKYVVASVDPVVWGFVIPFSTVAFTQAQMNTINSGLTSEDRKKLLDLNAGLGLINASSTDDFADYFEDFGAQSNRAFIWTGTSGDTYTYTDFYGAEQTVTFHNGDLFNISFDATHFGFTLRGNINGNIVPISDSITIPTSSWSALADSDPFKYSATATITTTLDSSKTVTLINNTPVLFAKYGFQISAVSGQNVTIIAVEQPDESITLKVEVK